MQIKGYKGGRTDRTSYNLWDVGNEGKRDFKMLPRCQPWWMELRSFVFFN